MTDPRRGAGGARLRRRLVVPLVLVTGVACALMAWASLVLVRETFDEQLAADLDSRKSALAGSLEAIRGEVAAATEGLVTFLGRDDPEGLARLLGGGPAAAGEAARLASRARLQSLEILDGAGTVLSSAPWPEQAGLSHRELLELAADGVSVREAEQPSGRAPAFVARRELRVGSRIVHVVGGLLLDAASLARSGGVDAWLRVGPPAGEAYVLGEPPVDPAAAWRQVGASPDGRGELGTAASGRWRLARHDLAGGPDGGGVRATLVVAASRAASDRRLAGVRRTLAVVTALAALLAAGAGLWIARRVTAPVAELVRSVDAIAAGTEDYTFTRATRDEFEELTTSFSRLHRSLELQRERSRAAERIAAWRDVARRVAHEVKNPLAPIRLTVENLVRARRRPGPLFDEMFDDGAATILEEVDRLRRLVGEFSEFARLPLPDPRPTDLAALIDEVAGLYAAEPDLALDVRHPPGLPRIPLDADQISRALQNVVRNGIQAMRELPAGRPRELAVRTEVDDAMVRIEVCDRGPGLAPEVLDRLFEPYFTTRSGGTGLGLAIAYRIVTEHGGVIAAANRSGGGARVTIRLPLAGPGSVASSERVARGHGGPGADAATDDEPQAGR